MSGENSIVPKSVKVSELTEYSPIKEAVWGYVKPSPATFTIVKDEVSFIGYGLMVSVTITFGL